MHPDDIIIGHVYLIGRAFSHGGYSGTTEGRCVRTGKRGDTPFWVFELVTGELAQRHVRGIYRETLCPDWGQKKQHFQDQKKLRRDQEAERRHRVKPIRERFEVLSDTLKDIFPTETGFTLFGEDGAPNVMLEGVPLAWLEAMVACLQEAKKKITG